ncbi:MAG: DUF4250 domain-containing protein [Eubacterium sp.]|nr:DUF4250 domain-containing protein [Eubacterium sp.]
MELPNQPIMLMSFVNTQLRDEFPSLRELALSYGVDEKEIVDKLKSVGFIYNDELNKFVPAEVN